MREETVVARDGLRFRFGREDEALRVKGAVLPNRAFFFLAAFFASRRAFIFFFCLLQRRFRMAHVAVLVTRGSDLVSPANPASSG